MSGRPGPVWLDIPLDIQSAEVSEDELSSYQFSEKEFTPEISDDEIARVISRLEKAERPAIVCGIGVRHAGAADKLISFAEKHKIPVLTSISGIDLIESDHPLFFGRPGILGERCANFVMQNSDLLLVIGTRMGIRIIGYAYETVAREACKIMVDIDPAELKKPTFRPDIAICGDAGDFLDRIADVDADKVSSSGEWLDYCRRMREKYPVITPEHRRVENYVSSYVFPELIGRKCKDNSIIVTGNGIAYTSTFQAIPLKKGIRMFSNEACASMGYGLPAAVGAAFAGKNREVICLTGDGSIQMNIQELQTVKSNLLPIKLFVYNNDGYLSIKLTQNSFFDGNFVGSEPGSGVVLPDMEKLAAAYGLPYFKLRNNREAEEKLPEILAMEGPVLTEVMTDPFEVPGPKAASKRLPDGRMISAPLEDLAPFLPREEFKENMIISPVREEF